MKNNAAMEDHWTNNPRFAEAKQEQGEPWGHGGRPMTLRECMEAEEPKQGHSFTYAQMKEQVEGLQRDYDLLLAEYNLLKQEQSMECVGEPVAYIHRNEYNEYRLEPHDNFDIKSIPFNVDVPLFKSPQQRTWVGLTDEDSINLTKDSEGKSRHWLAWHVEQKLKEKNT